MAKRKVLIETVNNYHGLVHGEESDWIAYEVMLKLNGIRFEAEVEVTSKDNPGGQVWDWATSNWDKFISKDGPTVRVLVEGAEVDVATELRWACITGVYNTKGQPLAIKQISYKSSETRAYAKGEREKRGKKLEPVEVKAEYKEAKKPDRNSPPKPPAEVFDFEGYKQEKIRKALEEEE